MNKNINNNKINTTNFYNKNKLENKFLKDCDKKNKNKNKKLCNFYMKIFINKMLYNCIYPDFIESNLKKFIQ
jgi:hypothetical protein